ncbi:hypothetical protein ACFL6S_35665, partial [Candidatus Poribacteria bacterium]
MTGCGCCLCHCERSEAISTKTEGISRNLYRNVYRDSNNENREEVASSIYLYVIPGYLFV